MILKSCLTSNVEAEFTDIMAQVKLKTYADPGMAIALFCIQTFKDFLRGCLKSVWRLKPRLQAQSPPARTQGKSRV
jgi:hypothetical protein